MDWGYDPYNFLEQLSSWPKELPPDLEAELYVDVPHHRDTLPDGHAALILGDPEGCKQFNHEQGDNPFGFRGTCGLVACEDVLRQFGVAVTEADVVRYAVQHGLCEVSSNPETAGGVSLEGIARILSDCGVSAHVESFVPTLLDLASQIERGKSVIVSLNAGILWDDSASYDTGMANHAVVVTGVARDPRDLRILGFYINDSGSNPAHSARFVDTITMDAALLQSGGGCVVTEGSHYKA